MEINEIKEKVKAFIASLPFEVADAIIYGSLAFPQANNDITNGQVDLMTFIDNMPIREALIKDIEAHPEYYCKEVRHFIMKKNSEKKLLRGAPIAFFPYREFDGITIKWGLGSLSSTVKKNSQFVFGRTAKEIEFIKSEPALENAVELNRKKDLIAALILLDEDKCYIDNLLNRISSFSYIGDIRKFGYEAVDKVSNIVEGNRSGLIETYLKYGYFKLVGNKVIIQKDKIREDLKSLPKDFRRLITIDPFNCSECQLNILRKKIKLYYLRKNLVTNALVAVKGRKTAGKEKAKRYKASKKDKYNKSIVLQKQKQKSL